MRPGIFVLSAALVLAAVAGQNTLLQPTRAETTTPVTGACAVQGEGCEQPSLGSTPGAVISHTVFAGACSGADLHVMRYAPADGGGGAPVVANWCP